MKRCEKCGKISDSGFCPDCGGKIVEIDEIKSEVADKAMLEIENVEQQADEIKAMPESEVIADTVLEKESEGMSLPENIEKTAKKNNSNKKWFARKSFIIPTVFAVLFGFFWLSSPTAGNIDELQTELSSLEVELSSLQTEYDEYKEEMAKFEGFTAADLEQAKKEREKEEKKKQKELEEEKKKGYNTGITYNQLARNPEKYEGKKIKFSGRVVQLIEGDGDEIQIRLAVNDDYDNILYCGYNKDIVSSRVLEDDYITVYGVSRGTITYDSTMGGQITIPAAWVEKIDQ